jgi:hypothetical protein
MSTDPCDKKLMMTIDVRGDHKTLGMNMEPCPARGRLRLLSMEKSTPAAKVPKWRSTLRHSFLLSINNEEIFNHKDMEDVIARAHTTKAFKTWGIMVITSHASSVPCLQDPTLSDNQLCHQ